MQYSNIFQVAFLIAACGTLHVRAQGFSTECTDISYLEGWLIGTCPTSDATGEIKSSVYLPNKIENNNQNLEWKTDGGYEESCSDCSLVDSGSTLQCSCPGSYTGQTKVTTLDLESYVANYDGHLLSNLTGSITSIPANSSYAVPADFLVELQVGEGVTTCDNDGGTFSWYSPEDCFSLNPGVVTHFSVGKEISNQGWEITGYANDQCTGDVLSTLTPSDVGVCSPFGAEVYAFKVTPLWNAN